ncbi:MAG: succinate dehydrogenase assembly factor 2 [Hyphomicrobiaceae bacterium]|nr:succinate dehydrogenase assembly factor 2 [Hyphomicrobiaceae bacterium]
MPGEDLETRRRRAAYRAAHRGTKEMDWLIGRFAAALLPGLDGEALDRFERFLRLPDPELHEWFHSPQLAGDSEFSELIAALRRFHRLD